MGEIFPPYGLLGLVGIHHFRERARFRMLGTLLRSSPKRRSLEDLGYIPVAVINSFPDKTTP